MLSRKRIWTDEENARLKSNIDKGGSAFRASVIFKRSEPQVRLQAIKLGLKFPTIRQLRAPALQQATSTPSAGAGEEPAGR